MATKEQTEAVQRAIDSHTSEKSFDVAAYKAASTAVGAARAAFEAEVARGGATEQSCLPLLDAWITAQARYDALEAERYRLELGRTSAAEAVAALVRLAAAETPK